MVPGCRMPWRVDLSSLVGLGVGHGGVGWFPESDSGCGSGRPRGRGRGRAARTAEPTSSELLLLSRDLPRVAHGLCHLIPVAARAVTILPF